MHSPCLKTRMKHVARKRRKVEMKLHNSDKENDSRCANNICLTSSWDLNCQGNANKIFSKSYGAVNCQLYANRIFRKSYRIFQKKNHRDFRTSGVSANRIFGG